MSKKIDHLEIYLRYYSFKRTLIIVIIIAVVFLLLGVWGNDFIKDISRNMLKLWIIMCALAFIFSYPVLFSIRDKKENDITKLKGKKSCLTVLI